MIKCYIMDTDANENVGKHFKVKEFACKDGSQVVFIDSYLVCKVLVPYAGNGRRHSG